MSRSATWNPYFIVVLCLIIAVVGVTNLVRMPVDMFSSMNTSVVVVATFCSGMLPEQIEADITSRFERFFTLGRSVEHIELRPLPASPCRASIAGWLWETAIHVSVGGYGKGGSHSHRH